MIELINNINIARPTNVISDLFSALFYLILFFKVIKLKKINIDHKNLLIIFFLFYIVGSFLGSYLHFFKEDTLNFIYTYKIISFIMLTSSIFIVFLFLTNINLNYSKIKIKLLLLFFMITESLFLIKLGTIENMMLVKLMSFNFYFSFFVYYYFYLNKKYFLNKKVLTYLNLYFLMSFISSVIFLNKDIFNVFWPHATLDFFHMTAVIGTYFLFKGLTFEKN